MDVELAETADFLARHPPFDTLPPDVLATTVRACTVRYARRGTVVLRVGELNDRLFVVRSGAVELTDEGAVVDRVGAGGAFGMSALVEHLPTRYDCTASEDSLLITLPQADFDTLVATHPQVAVHFAATHHGRIKAAIGNLHENSRGSVVLKTAVKDLLDKAPVTAGPDVSIAEAARVMTGAGVSSLLVMADEQLVGILTDGDLRRRVLAAGVDPARPIAEVMTTHPRTVGEQALAFEVMMEMTGHNLHHLPVVDATGAVRGLVASSDLIRLEQTNPVYLVSELSRQDTIDDVATVAGRIPQVVSQLVDEDASAEDIGRAATALVDAVVVRLLEIAEAELRQELGRAPGTYAWVALGSAARQELALGGDQDHALVLADYTDPGHPWWAALAEKVTAGLEAAGLPRCTGDVMATNPRWRMTVTQWRRCFADWATEPDPEAVLQAAIFYDLRSIHGDHDLVEELRALVVRAAARSDRLRVHLTGQALRMRPPIGFFRGFVLEDAGEHRDTLDIKRGIAAIVQLARVYALQAGSTALPTTSRLTAAQAAGLLSAESATDLADALELMSYLRLHHQVRQVREGRRPDNHLDPKAMGSLDRRHLRDAFAIVRSAQHVLGARAPRGIGT